MVLTLCAFDDARAARLTGILITATHENGAATDEIGNHITGGLWDTVGGNGNYNIWLNRGAFGGELVNGPTDDNAGIALNLGGGFNDFTMQFAGNDIGVEHYGINLFFDDNSAVPRISVFSRQNGAPFTVNSSPLSLALDSSPAPAAGTAIYTEGFVTAELVKFSWFVPGVHPQDRIGRFTAEPDGNDRQNEFTAQMTLKLSGPFGDTNGDGAVDVTDLNNVLNNFRLGELGGPPIPGDAFPFDGVVDLGDLNLVRNYFGTSADTAAVPEAAGFGLATLALLAASLCARIRIAAN